MRRGVAARRATRDAGDPVLGFMGALWAVDHGLQKVSKRMARQLGVTGPQRLVLRIVGRKPGVSAGDLARALHLHPSTVTGILQRLVGARLLARRTDERDARRAVLELTRRGKAINTLRAGTAEAAVRDALATVPAHRLAAARTVLDRLAARLRERSPVPKAARPTARRRRTPRERTPM